MIQRKKKGTNNGATRVATSIPPMTLVPMAWRLAAPAPVLTARGTQPRMKASEVITMGRGTLIATITRERNPKPLNAVQKGEVCAIHSELEGTYVQAGTPLATIRHFLSKDEVLRILLKQALNLFVAPERAKYYFVPQIDTKIKVSGCRSVSVYEGMELFIVSRGLHAPAASFPSIVMPAS